MRKKCTKIVKVVRKLILNFYFTITLEPFQRKRRVHCTKILHLTFGNFTALLPVGCCLHDVIIKKKSVNILLNFKCFFTSEPDEHDGKCLEDFRILRPGNLMGYESGFWKGSCIFCQIENED